MLFLSPPDARYQDTYLAALREYQAEGRHLEVDYEWVAAHFKAFVRDRLEQAQEPSAFSTRVPESYFWLIDGEEYIGTTRVRHRLNDFLRRYGGNIGYEIRPSKRRLGYGKQILKLALREAKALGLRRALITCNRDNVGSRKIIEASGGVFEGEGPVRIGREIIHERRYWIEIP
jgi:predicted acetyltransferase